MLLYEFLKSKENGIVNEAVKSLQRLPLKHYNASRAGENRERLSSLFELTLKCIETKNLVDIVEYSETITKERFNSGFDLIEVYTAYNVLEEEIWKVIIKEIEPAKLAESLGLVSTVLGKGKETLAVTFVTLAGKTKVRSLDLSEMFKGV